MQSVCNSLGAMNASAGVVVKITRPRSRRPEPWVGTDLEPPCAGSRLVILTALATEALNSYGHDASQWPLHVLTDVRFAMRAVGYPSGLVFVRPACPCGCEPEVQVDLRDVLAAVRHDA